MIKEMYPIGTCVKTEKYVVIIIGRIQKIDDDSFHDYVGIRYPIGFEGVEKLVNFKESEIQEVIKIGYIDEEEENFKMKILDMLYSGKNINEV